MSKVITEQETEYAKIVAKEFTRWLRDRGEYNPRRATLTLWLEYNGDTYKHYHLDWNDSRVIDIIWSNVWK